MRASNDIAITGSALTSGGNLTADAGHTLTLTAARRQETSDYRVQTAQRDASGTVVSAGRDLSVVSTGHTVVEDGAALWA